MNRVCRRGTRDDRGATLVEFALTSLVFFVMVFGVIEFSRMIMNYNIVSNAARDGVRYASMRGASSGRAATAGQVQTYVAGKSAGLLTTSNVTVTWPTNNQTGSTVQVQVQYNFSSVVSLLPAGVINLRSTARAIIVR